MAAPSLPEGSGLPVREPCGGGVCLGLAKEQRRKTRRHGGAEVLPVGVGAVSLPQPGLEGASGKQAVAVNLLLASSCFGIGAPALPHLLRTVAGGAELSLTNGLFVAATPTLPPPPIAQSSQSVCL